MSPTCEPALPAELIRDIDCGLGCLHPMLRVEVPSLDFQSCTEDGQDPHLHTMLHAHGGDRTHPEAPALHLERSDEAWDGNADDHEVEGHEVLTWLTFAATNDAAAIITLSTPSEVTLVGSVYPDQCAAAVEDYVATGEAEFEVYLDPA